jgi:hypothetical protein
MQRDSHGLSRGVPSGESRSSESRTHGERVFVLVRVAEVGSTHRASSAPGGRKASWSERALAGRKPEALPDAGHGWREGETVRGQALVLNGSTLDRPAGASLQVLNTTEGALGLLCIRLSRVGCKRVLRLAGQRPPQLPRASDSGSGQRIGRFRRPTRACLQVTTRASEIDGIR